MKRSFSRHGQTSTELLAIAAVAFVMITLFVFLSQGQVADINKARVDEQADNMMSDISGAAKEVYAQGLGAKKKVYVNVPSGVDPLRTQISNKSLLMRVAGNDYVKTEEFDVHGMLPTSEGGHWVWVVSEGNKVRIGNAMIGLSTQVLLITIMPNESASKSFEVTNIWNSPIDITISDDWSASDVSLSRDSSSASLGVDESKTITATLTTGKDAIGIYVSEMTFEADDGNGNQESLSMPVIVQVVADPNARPPLIAIPPMFEATLNRSESTVRSFQICTNQKTSVSHVNFTPSPGEPGGWIGGSAPLGAIPKDSCVEKFLSVSVPNDSGLGNFTGFVFMQGDAPDAEDSIGLLIEVGGGGDMEGPIVRNITTSFWRVHINEPTTILATADDNLTGGSRIKSCAISTDGSDWEYMYPVDGTFDSSIENVSYTYFDGFGFGRHNVSINCTDWPGNIGPTANYSFVIGKHILFVVAQGNESDWADWITVHYSGEGYAWDYDIADFNDVLGGAVNMNYYDTVIFIDWKNDADFVDLVLEYLDQGGWTGLFGDSAHQAVNDLNVTWHPDNPHPETEVNIMNNSHYVTSPFSTGLLEISTLSTKIYSVWGDPVNTSELGASGWFYPSTDRVVLAQVDNMMFWGPMDPWTLNEDGVEISTRVIDWMINQSLNR